MRFFCLCAIWFTCLLYPGLLLGSSVKSVDDIFSLRDSVPVSESMQPAGITITGEQKQWHPITITLDGPSASETGNPNPFLDYRFEVVFSLAEVSITVPGYFAADGNASETSASIGNKWRAHFTPPLAGNWTYRTTFREGTDVAVSTDPNAGTANQYDNVFGSLPISASDKTGRDFRGKGVLRYIQGHYLQFDNGEYFIKGGTDSPENLLAFEDFDATYNYGGTNFIKSYSAHVADWSSGDPTWQNGKGKGLIGALNYLASEEMNSVYFITMNVEGDGQDVWPWVSPTDMIRYDVSKLDQWNVVFSHMTELGLALHVVTQETENETLLNNGELGRARKLYYRELIARFSHQPALFWNLGEENDENTTSQRKSFASYIRELDPYDHPIVIHTFPGQYDEVYTPLLNFADFDGPSLQTSTPEKTHEVTLNWLQRSAESGKPWYVALDEAGPWQDGVTPDGPGNNHDTIRKNVLWGHLIAGGGGVEWYFGFNHTDNDLTAEDWRTRDNFWDYTRYALQFFRNHLPFPQMNSADALSSNADSHVLAKQGSHYVIYLPNGGTTNLNLESHSGTFNVRWFNPRTGGALQTGSVQTVTGPNSKSIGNPPSEAGQDWVVLVSTDDQIMYGDVTLNGGISAQDAAVILQHTTGIQGLTPQQEVPADVSGNGEISAFDASLVLQYVTNLIDCFPAEAGCSAGKTTAIRISSEQGEVKQLIQPTGTHLQWSSADQPYASSVEIILQISEKDVEAIRLHTPEDWQSVQHYQDGYLHLAAAGRPSVLPATLLSWEGNQSGLQGSIRLDEQAVIDIPSVESNRQPFLLEQNYPNPFQHTTQIRFSLPEDADVILEVFDATGRRVEQVANGRFSAGPHALTLHAQDWPSGLYVYRLTAGHSSSSKTFMLVR